MVDSKPLLSVASDVATGRCVLLFSRSPRAEVHAKRLPGAEGLFRITRERLAEAVVALEGVDLVELPQRGRTFAERLGNAFDDARALGYREIVAVPGDVPGLGETHLRAAFEALGTADVVLGPCPDGGVYLIGSRGPVVRLFDGVRWRTGFVLADLTARARNARVLAALSDLDENRDLAALETDPALPAHIRALVSLIRRRPVIPRTEDDAWVRALLPTAPDRPRGPPSLPSLH
jgi:2-phospho-L-lactate guanylyltransferase (CobY/MobA/RfbA family)